MMTSIMKMRVTRAMTGTVKKSRGSNSKSYRMKKKLKEEPNSNSAGPVMTRIHRDNLTAMMMTNTMKPKALTVVTQEETVAEMMEIAVVPMVMIMEMVVVIMEMMVVMVAMMVMVEMAVMMEMGHPPMHVHQAMRRTQ
jgi:hypothetical protein